MDNIGNIKNSTVSFVSCIVRGCVSKTCAFDYLCTFHKGNLPKHIRARISRAVQKARADLKTLIENEVNGGSV